MINILCMFKRPGVEILLTTEKFIKPKEKIIYHLCFYNGPKNTKTDFTTFKIAFKAFTDLVNVHQEG